MIEKKRKNKLAKKSKSKYGINLKIKSFDKFGTTPELNIGGEETYKTSLGVICTLLMLIYLIGTTFHYFLIYIKSKSPNISTQILSVGDFPQIDLPGKKFSLSIIMLQDGQPILPKDLEEEFITIEATHIRKNFVDDASSPRGFKAVFNRTKLEMKKCTDTDIDTSRFTNYRSGFGSKTVCLVLKNDTCIKGSRPIDDFQYIEIDFRPCNESNPKCIFYGLGQDSKMTGKFSKTGKLVEASRLMNATFETARLEAVLIFVEASVDVDNLENPLVHTVKNSIFMKFDINQEKYVDYYFRRFKVQSVTGMLFDHETEVSSISLDKRESEFKHRTPWAKTKIATLLDNSKELRTQNFYTIRLYASDTENVVIRSYTKLIDVFANIGGISEIITFVIAVLYSWHNGIKMELTMINKSLIGDDCGKKKVFRYGELICWNFFWCCTKKDNKRKKEFKECREILEGRLDILNYVKSQNRALALQKSFLKPYQLKLLPVLKQDKEPESNRKVSFEEALSILNLKEGKNNIDIAIDKYIRERLVIQRGKDGIQIGNETLDESKMDLFLERDVEDGLRNRKGERKGFSSSSRQIAKFDHYGDGTHKIDGVSFKQQNQF